jgi:hypothetical protein
MSRHVRRRGGLAILALALGVATPAGAQGVVFNRTGSGARAAGMANAFIAVSDDGTAASWNPAGLGQLRKPELSIVSTTLGWALSYEGFRSFDNASTFTPARTSFKNSYLDFASLAVPVTLWGKPTTFQGAWRRLYTLDHRELFSTTREPVLPRAPAAARIDSNTDVLGAVDLVSFAAAVKLTSRLSLGGSVNLWRGRWTEDTAMTETPLGGPGEPGFLVSHALNRASGDNLSLGLMLTYPRWSIGLLHQLPMNGDFDSGATIATTGPPPLAPLAIDGTMRFPRAFGVGGAWRPATHWTLALDLTWDDWRAASISAPQIGTLNLFDNLPPDRTSTRNTLAINTGAEHLFSGEGFVVPLRFGAAWEPQGGRNAYTRDPVDYVVLAAGTGYNTNSLKFDAAFQLRWTHFRTGANLGIVDPGPLPAALGERGIRQWLLKLSVIVRLTDTDKLREVARRVFGVGT